MEVINPEDDYVWVHDDHLMILPTFLQKRFCRVKLGFFLHSPFPSSEIYRSLPVREEILRGLMIRLDYESKRGHLGLDYFGRTVYVKILPVGTHMGRIESVLNESTTAASSYWQWHLLQQKHEFRGKLVMVQIINPARSSGKDVQEAKEETLQLPKGSMRLMVPLIMSQSSSLIAPLLALKSLPIMRLLNVSW
ncbi:putative alpha,alpha-trehalose-phosphate synthase [UDP-forming] 8 [Drosera capensis]